jgi:peptide deformylase
MPKILTITTEPNPGLRRRSTEIDLKEVTSREFREFIHDMKHTMVEKDGVGLAAPQVGRNIRLVIVNTKEGPQCFINPNIIKRSFLKEWGEEGCLSVPNIFGDVKRNKKIVCEYYNDRAELVRTTAEGLMARVFQHEIDHLDGILFIDKAKNVKKYEEKDQ